MKIAFAYDAPYPWHVGGIESMNYNEAEELAKKNDVHYFTMKWPGMKSGFIKDGIRYHAWHEIDQERLYRHGRRSIREAILYALSLTRLFTQKFDVVITNAFPITHLPIVKLYCRISGAKLIVEVAEAWDREYWKEYLGAFLGTIAYAYSNFAIRNADFYITISSTTTNKLAALGVDKKKTKIFAPAVDNKAIGKAYGKAARRKIVLFSGRMIKEKRLDKWLSTVKKAIAMDNGIKGMIIGRGPERSAVEASIKRMGLSGNVSVHNFYKNQSELYGQIRRSALTLHMSEREGLSIIAIESIALGTPVVLPSYTPLPKEVREMCIVLDEDKIPSKIAEIARSRNKSGFIRNKDNINMYSKSKVNEFYSGLFKSLYEGDQ
ncbi:MAG: glycosyltransferase family 4 protein [Candidatus Micrarchaeaceae archaeon]